MNSPKKILIIAYNFPPLISPQSLRWFYLVRELHKKGYDIDVLTVRMPAAYQTLRDKIPDSVKVHGVFPGPFYYLTYRYSRDPIKETGHDKDSKPSIVWKVLSGMHFLAYRILNTLLIPDIYSEWLPFAVQKGRNLLKSENYDVIISSAEPRMCHLAGYLLNKSSGVPWIADYGDPWVYPVSTFSEPYFKKRILEKIESKLLKKMDGITVASEGIKSLYLEKYPFLEKDRVYTVTQGYDPEMFSHLKTEKPSRFRIVYCGSLYSVLRDPMNFFNAVKKINRDDIEVVIAGRINEFEDIIKSYGPDGNIRYLGFLDHIKSLELQKSASVLLHIGNITDVQVPGKIYEYFGTQRPVLCIKSGDKDLSAELIIRYNRGFVVNNNSVEIKEAIMKLYGMWQNGRLETDFNRENLEDFTWQKSAEQVVRVIERL